MIKYEVLKNVHCRAVAIFGNVSNIYNVCAFCIYRRLNELVTYFFYNSNSNYFFQKCRRFLIHDNERNYKVVG